MTEEPQNPEPQEPPMIQDQPIDHPADQPQPPPVPEEDENTQAPQPSE